MENGVLSCMPMTVPFARLPVATSATRRCSSPGSPCPRAHMISCAMGSSSSRRNGCKMVQLPHVRLCLAWYATGRRGMSHSPSVVRRSIARQEDIPMSTDCQRGQDMASGVPQTGDVDLLARRLSPRHGRVAPRVPGGARISRRHLDRRWSLLPALAEPRAALADPHTLDRMASYEGNIENFIGTVK